MNIGKSIEDAVEYLCTQSFFSDFTIRSPKFYSSGGQEKEAADLLVVFNDTLLAIQVKTKEIDTSSQHVSPTELERVSKTIDKAMRQFSALGKAVRDPNFKSFTNARGIEIAFEKERINEVILIVVFAPIWTEASTRPMRLRFDTTCYPEGDIPIHLFSLEQFSLLLTVLNTLPDFVLFLTARWALHREKLIAADGDPIDEWAFTTFERKKAVEALERQIPVHLAGSTERHRISIERLERREKPSYFIDQMIERFYAAIGSKIPIDPRFNLLAEPNSPEAYHLLIPQLAKLNREERSRIAEYLINRVQDSRKQDIAFRGFKFSEHSDEAFVVLASPCERSERLIALSNVARGMGFKLNAKTVLGIAVDSNWPESPCCDVLFMDVSKNNQSPDLLNFTDKCFGKMRSVENIKFS